jgi:hypothetical protein
MPRVYLVTLMVLVGVAAVNLAAARAIYAHNLDVLIGVCLSGLTLQYGMCRLLRSRGRARAFWAGFVAAGLLATSSYAWATGYPKLTAVFVDRDSRKLVTYSSPGAPLSDLWENYSSIAIDGLEYLPFCAGISTRRLSDPAAICADALIAFLPQVMIAVVGGLLSFVTAAVFGRWSWRQSMAAVS